MIGFCFHKLLIKQLFPKIALIGLAVCLLYISWKREVKFDQDQLQVFSSKAFCGMIQYKGKLITFTEDTPKNKQILQTLKNAVRDSGLNLNQCIVLKSGNKLDLDGNEISFTETESGWKFKIGEQEFNYLLKGNPGKSHNKALLSQRLQHYLYNDERIEPFCVPI